MKPSRPALLAAFGLALAAAQFRESGSPALSAHLELITEPNMPVRVYLFKDKRPFRLTPVQSMLALKADQFYRDRLWRNVQSPDTLEVACNGQSHFFLLKGRASFDLPAGRYHVECYRGLFFTPVVEEFELKAGETRRVPLRLKSWMGERAKLWRSGDDHIHLTRSREDNAIFLNWLEADDLSIGHFLQLQRQMDAAVQYTFGRAGEARLPGYSVRSGQESRTEFYGHINLLGGRELIRPVSAGSMYANSPEAYPFPSVVFDRGRALGATVGYAHFNGSMPHSTLLMDLALSKIDFAEVLQFGVLKTEPWYELLNAGLRVTGIAGSDFPGRLSTRNPWPRWLPLLGPERTLFKAREGESVYESWGRSVRSGEVVVSNGPLVDISVDQTSSSVTATAEFFRPLEKLEIVKNGEVVVSVPGDGKLTALKASARVSDTESCWVAARTSARKEESEPDIQAHTNPVYLLRAGRPVMIRAARESVAARWEAEVNYYRSAGLAFGNDSQSREFFSQAEQALKELRRPLSTH